MLCKEAGFYIEKVIYDMAVTSNSISDLYQKTFYSLKKCASMVKVSNYECRLTKELNRKKDGDQAIFYLRREN